MTVASGNAVATHGPEQGVQRSCLLAEEVPGIVVGGGGLGYLLIRLRLDAVDQIGKLDCVLDEENGDVIADDVEVAW